MIKNFLFLTGEDSYRLQERVRFYRHHFQEKYADGEIESFDEDAGFSAVEGAVLTPNLFGGKRLIFTEKFWKPETFEQAEKSEFFASLKEAHESATLISIEPKLDKRTKAAKSLLKTAHVESFDPLEEDQIIDWAMKFSAQEGSHLARAEARYLVNRCGQDLWNLASEIRKLISASDGAITTDLIDQLTLPHPQAVTWDFLEHLSHRRTARALETFQKLLTMGQSLHEIFGMMMRELRIHAMIRDGLDRNQSHQQIVSETKLHPFVVQKTMPATRHFSRKHIRQLYEELSQLDKKLKTGGIAMTADDMSEFQLQIEKFVVGLGS